MGNLESRGSKLCWVCGYASVPSGTNFSVRKKKKSELQTKAFSNIGLISGEGGAGNSVYLLGLTGAKTLSVERRKKKGPYVNMNIGL